MLQGLGVWRGARWRAGRRCILLEPAQYCRMFSSMLRKSARGVSHVLGDKCSAQSCLMVVA